MSRNADYASRCRKQLDKALADMKRELRGSKWKRHEIDAAEAGWELAMDRCCDAADRERGYEYQVPKDWDGSDEAYDMAAALLEDLRGSKNQSFSRDAIADLIYTGIRAGLRAVRDLPEPVGTERAISVEAGVTAISTLGGDEHDGV